MLLSISYTNRKRAGRMDSLDAPYLSFQWIIMSSGHRTVIKYYIISYYLLIFMLRYGK